MYKQTGKETKKITKRGVSDSYGQALLFVVVMLTISLSVGVSVASRLLSTTSRVSRVDTASRAYAVAEGGAERFLILSEDELGEVSEEGSHHCPSGLDYVDDADVCRLELADSDDEVSVHAFVTADKFRYTDGESYTFGLENLGTREVALSSYGDSYSGDSVEVCWNSEGGDSYLYYSMYDEDGFTAKGGIESVAGTHASDVLSFDSGGSCSRSSDYTNGGVIDIPEGSLGLRLRSLYGRSMVAVYPESGKDLVAQGYKITSVGKLESPGEAEVSKTVTVYRPIPYLSGILEFALYSEGELN